MAKDYHRLLLLFVDGLGLAPASESNPLWTVPTPALDGLLGTSLTADALDPAAGDAGRRDGVVLAALDARLGVDGLPQSATGQTTLFTGVNAPAALGRHVTAFPGARLREILAEHSLLKRAVERGLDATFANPYTPGYFRRTSGRRRGRHSASTWSVLAAGLRLRDLDDLRADRAVAWDVERDLFGARLREERPEGEPPLERVDAAAAGGHLAELARGHRLTLYETFYTDLAGHRRWGLEPAEAVRRVDELMGGLLSGLRGGDVTVVLTSDHGNLEDGSHTLHTENPVPLLAVGPAAGRFADLTRLDQVAGRILEVLTSETGGS
ncbi:MAG: alkaline phosphatase family protein [Acidobacteriota bacterium]|jgi:hypothetical protein